MSNWRIVLLILSGIVIGAGVGVAVLFGFGSGKPAATPAGNSDLPVAPEKGALAPDFTLQGLNGDQVNLNDFRGKDVLINFWATWCGPCRIEMPTIQARFEQHNPNLAVLAVDFDEPAPQVQAFVDELGLTFDVLLDPGGEIQKLYQVRGYPTSVFVDQDGVVQIVHIGIVTESQLDGYLSDLGLVE